MPSMGYICLISKEIPHEVSRFYSYIQSEVFMSILIGLSRLKQSIGSQFIERNLAFVYCRPTVGAHRFINYRLNTNLSNFLLET